MKSTLENIATGIAESFLDLEKKLNSDDQLISFLATLGWDFTNLSQSNLQPLKNLKVLINSINDAVLLYNSSSGNSNLSQLIQAINSFYIGVKSLANANYDTLLITESFPSIIAKQISDYAIIEYISKSHSSLFHFLKVSGVIQIEYIAATGIRLSYFRKTLSLNNFSSFLQNPLFIFENRYGWGTNDFKFEIFSAELLEILKSLGFDTKVELIGSNELIRLNNLTELPNFCTNLVSVIKFINIENAGILFETGIKLNPLFTDSTRQGGVSIMPFSSGGFNKTIEVYPGLVFKLSSTITLADGAVINIRPNQPAEFIPDIYDMTSGSLQASGRLSFGLMSSPISGDSKEVLISLKDGSKVVYDSVSIIAGINLNTSGNSNYFVELDLVGLQFLLNSGEGDGFIKKIFPSNGFKTPLNLTIGYSNQNKFYFKGSSGLEIDVPLKKGNNKSVDLEKVNIGINATNGLNAYITASGKVKLGPVTALVEQVGLGANFSFPSNGGNLGPINADIGFAPPKGIAIDIDSGNVKGGGYLFFDSAKGQYSGVASLTLKGGISLKAIGILTTKDDPVTGADYSLLFIITAEGFKPIPLGMGFTLNGVGGLVGINRSLNEQRLRQGVQDNSLSYLLFPKDPIGDAPQIIASAGQAFPVANGRYAFGLMGKIAWGPNALITLDLGLVIEVPSPVRLAILGVLRAMLPSENNAKLKLQVNFLGFIDFDKKQISFDASLFDSKLLDSALTGDMAFRLYQGEKPVFLVTVGGFHPAFTPPPANLPTLRRLVMTVVNRSNLKMIMESYFALTSNTVQFGCRLDMRAEIGDFAVVGYFSFDTLFQFNPFQLILDIAAEVAIKYGSKTLLSLYLSLHLDGPSPWHVTGKASFKAFGFTVEKSIDKTIGNHQPEALPAQVNVRQQLVAALSDIANWEVEKGANTFDLVTTRPITATQGRLFVNPAGQLVVRQKVAPLQFRFDKFGNSVPVNGNEFDITQATFGAGSGSSAPLSPVEDAFAPAQFRSMSNEEKLAAPSFQRMKNGVRFKATESYKGGAGVVKPLAYEVVVLEKADPATLPLDQAEAGFVSLGGGQTVEPLNQIMFRGLSRNSVASRSSLSKEQSAPSKLAHPGVYWDQDRYAVVYKSSMEYYEIDAEYGSEAEADAYLKKLLELKPELENELQVIPIYELDHQMVLA